MGYLRTILVVDGDHTMREMLQEQLTRDGAFAVVAAAGAQEARSHLDNDGTHFAAVIMDVDLPDGSGRTLCAWMRDRGFAVPVILMNGASMGLAGENTIAIAKPFRLSELMAHLRARVEHATEGGDDVAKLIRIGPYEFSPEDKALRNGDASHRIRLTEKEVAILRFLHREDRAVPRRELLTEVWGYNPAVTTHTLETHIYRLRRKIELNPAKACLLVTESGGYRLASGG